MTLGLAPIVRWWRFLTLIRRPDRDLAVSPTWRSQSAEQMAVWDRVRRARGIRRTTLRPQPRRAIATPGDTRG